MYVTAVSNSCPYSAENPFQYSIGDAASKFLEAVREVVALSILYWRCVVSDRDVEVEIDHFLSILYWRCRLRVVLNA